uniref:Salt tolerant protein n=1 Tax=Tetraselmis sp. GSL018 TaxID=582737 RepID=A0A061SMH5_9CHLO|mmetsp:Transcript_29175/g.69670  ORF Transcript_29175/g.69670 Transcript_29175/m.69670 type:complete len:93 (+) Transcript_29175:100-378(+)
MINCTRREDLQSGDILNDDGRECRLKLWLFLSYCMAFGAIFGSVWLLFDCKSAGEHIWEGAAAVIQCLLIVLSALVMWLLRPPAEGRNLYGF